MIFSCMYFYDKKSSLKKNETLLSFYEIINVV